MDVDERSSNVMDSRALFLLSGPCLPACLHIMHTKGSTWMDGLFFYPPS